MPAAIAGNAAVCNGLITSLSDATPVGTWSASNTNAGIDGSGNVTGSNPGLDTVSYALTTGCKVTRVVTVNALPGTISGSLFVCATQTTSLSDAGSGSWTTSNAGATVSSSGVVTGVSAGTTAITYTLPTTCLTTAVVTVNAVVVPSIILNPASRDTVCSGTAVLYTTAVTNEGTAPVYQWKVNSTLTAATSSTYTYTPSNGDVVSAILTSNATCAIPATVTAKDTITVIHTDTSSVSVNVTPGDTICLGSPALFTAAGLYGGTSPVYIWSVNGSQVSTGITYAYVPANNDNVYCQLVSSLRCVAVDTVSSNHIVMTVDTSYIPSVLVYATPGANIPAGTVDTFKAIVSNAGPVVTYQWVVNTTVIPGATTDIYYRSNLTDNDSVTCVVTSIGHCGYASFNSITVHVIATGVQQVTAGVADIRLLPNPNKGQFTVKGTLGTIEDEEVSIEITDILGQVVYKNKVMARNGIINEAVSLSSSIMANGMYMLNLHSANEHKVFHFVVEQ